MSIRLLDLLILSYPMGRQTQRYILQPSYTFSTYAQKVHCDLHVPARFERKQNGDQALALFERDLEMPLGERCIILEEAQDGTNYELIK